MVIDRRRQALRARIAACAAALPIVVAMALHNTPTYGQTADLGALIFDRPCSDLIGTSAEEVASQNAIVGALFTGFIAATVPQSQARALYADLFDTSVALGALCQAQDVTLYEAMTLIVANRMQAD